MLENTTILELDNTTILEIETISVNTKPYGWQIKSLVTYLFYTDTAYTALVREVLTEQYADGLLTEKIQSYSQALESKWFYCKQLAISEYKLGRF